MLKLSSKWVKVMLPYWGGGGRGLPVVVGADRLMTHNAGSVTTHGIEPKICDDFC